MGEFRMPSLGADMDSGTIAEWRVAPGDAVHRGDIVAVVETDKSDIEVEVFEDGIVEELLVEVGHEVAVGTPLARIAPAGTPPASPPRRPDVAPVSATPPDPEASADPVPSPGVPPPEVTRPAVRAEPTAGSARSTGAAPRVRSSPLARRRAAQQGIDLATVSGSGPGGAVRADDLGGPGDEPPVPPPAPPVVRDRGDRPAAMRRAIGALMARSKREIPHYYVGTTIDLAPASAWLHEQNAHRSVAERLLPAVLLLKASALAAREVPSLNGFWSEGFQPGTGVHLGVAVALRGGGLIAPAIHDADRLSVDDLMAALRDLVERARAGRLRASEMSDSTITVTNLGDGGADEVYGVIYPPQVALVGFGRVVERPWAVDGMLAVHPTVRATLAADHRATDGHDGSRFLSTIDRLLQAPEDL